MKAKRGSLRAVTPVAAILVPQRVDGVVELPVPIRGRWIGDRRYGDLRNAAWFVRNYRMVGHDDSLAMARLCYEAAKLLRAGEPVESVIPSLVDLFLRP